MAKFESKPCTRCGGSGKFSYNLMHGDKCYGCNGSGIQHTKRGSVAATFYYDSLRVLAEDVAVGDLVDISSMFVSGFRKVDALTKGKAAEFGYTGVYAALDMVKLNCGDFSTLLFSNQQIRKGWTGAEKQEKQVAALAFQGCVVRVFVDRQDVILMFPDSPERDDGVLSW